MTNRFVEEGGRPQVVFPRDRRKQAIWVALPVHTRRCSLKLSFPSRYTPNHRVAER